MKPILHVKLLLASLLFIFIGCTAPDRPAANTNAIQDTIPDTIPDSATIIEPVHTDSLQPVPFTQLTIETRSLFYTTKSGMFTIDIKYPVINGFEDKALETKINRVLKKQFVDKEYIRERLKAEEEVENADCHFEQEIDFHTVFLSDKYFSFVYVYGECSDDCYGSGPCNNYEYYNYNLTNGKQYKLTDLLTGDYRSAFRKNVKSLTEMLSVKPEMLKASTDVINHLPFFVSKNENGSHTLKIVVDYERWSDYVEIPLDSNLSLIHPQGPLRFMLK